MITDDEGTSSSAAHSHRQRGGFPKREKCARDRQKEVGTGHLFSDRKQKGRQRSQQQLKLLIL